MSTDADCVRIIKGRVFFYLKCGKKKLAKALTLAGLEEKIRKDLKSAYEYLVALDIFRTKNPNLA